MFSIPSVSAKQALRTENGAVVVADRAKLPGLVRELYKPMPCEEAGTFRVVGRFFDFAGSPPSATNAPYSLRIREAHGSTGSEPYEGATLAITINKQTDPTLDVEERDRLWEASELSFRVRCTPDKGFEAIDAAYEGDLY